MLNSFHQVYEINEKTHSLTLTRNKLNFPQKLFAYAYFLNKNELFLTFCQAQQVIFLIKLFLMTQYEKDFQNNFITSNISFLLDIKTKQAFSFRLRYPSLWLPCWLIGKESSGDAIDAGLVPGSGRSPREGNTTHSSILAWEIPRTEEPGRLQSIGSQ